MPRDWLFDVVILNESRDEAAAGDISLFRSVGEACAQLEPWWVEDGEGFAYTATGERLELAVDGYSVVVVGRRNAPGGAELVRDWLGVAAAGVLAARKAKAARRKAVLSAAEEQGQLPTSLEGLIAYVGFGR